MSLALDIAVWDFSVMEVCKQALGVYEELGVVFDML